MMATGFVKCRECGHNLARHCIDECHVIGCRCNNLYCDICGENHKGGQAAHKKVKQCVSA